MYTLVYTLDLASQVLPGRRNSALNTAAYKLRPALDALVFEHIEEELLAACERN